MAFATLDEVKAELCIDADSEAFDDFLTRKIGAIQGQIETYCARSFEEETLTQDTDFPEGSIALKKYPVSVITEVRLDGVVLVNTDYFLDNESGLLFYKPAVGRLGVWERSGVDERVSIDYTGGYDPIPADLLDVFFALIKEHFDNKDRGQGKNVKFHSVPDNVSVAYFDSAKADATFGLHIDVVNEYRSAEAIGIS